MEYKEDYKRKLFEKYTAGKLTEQEFSVFFQLISNGDLKDIMNDDMDLTIKNLSLQSGAREPDKEKLFNWNIFIRVAAAIILVAGLSYSYFYWSGKQAHPIKTDIANIYGGTNKAALILPNGKSIVLETDKKGLKIDKSGISYFDGSTLVNVQGHASKLEYNTIVVPRGGQYHITFSDGSKVWLNAGSSLKFPVEFLNQERIVELKGEGYFEVAKSEHNGKRKPFIVKTPAQEIHVIGTHFNVHEYAEEKFAKTSLLEGSVQVKGNLGQDQWKLLAPGEEAQVKDNELTVAKSRDITQSIAWKKGLFSFESTPFETLLNEVARWYDIQVVYTGKVPVEYFSGDMDRSVSLKVFLDFLSESGIRYQLENRVLTFK